MIHQETQRFRRNSSICINRIRVSVCFCTLKQSGSIVQFINTIVIRVSVCFCTLKQSGSIIQLINTIMY
ncbi:hypothetical protein HanXRQr2_Chr09g0411121 [Helianthus annuus]|uniref:Uncharacterized protein n=1 Tax=Helianthus annuus TaxID=4232 RepID=A0A251U2P3_HELAN|nr:hypothetical protein HanXRQr2_Chr09g0411121 [Helianthus annuus]